MSTNPYQAPLADADAPVASQSNRIDFGATIGRWERYRIFYNGVLILLVLVATALAMPLQIISPEYWFTMIVGAIVCNVCFFLGPAAEGYLVWLGWWRKGISLAILAAGTCLSALAAMAALSGM